MSQNLDKYKELYLKLGQLQKSTGLESVTNTVEESHLSEEMDELWWELTNQEQAEFDGWSEFWDKTKGRSVDRLYSALSNPMESLIIEDSIRDIYEAELAKIKD